MTNPGTELSLWFACLVVLVLAALGGAIVYLLRTRVHIVPEGEQIVVYQLGRFQRVAGPGPVLLNRALDTVERTITVRDEPANYRVANLFSYGLPFGYTLNFWRRTDLAAAARDGHAQLRQLALFSDDERRNQVNTLLRETLVHTLARLEQQHPLPAAAGIVDKLLPVLPGIPRCDELLSLLHQELARRLPAVGVYVNMRQPIVIQTVHVGDDIVESFSRGRKVALLREQWPGLTPEMLLQAFSAIEGLDQLPQSHFVLDAGGAAAAAQVEVRPTDEVARPRVKMRPVAAPPPPPAQEVAAPQSQPSVSGEERLSPDDLSVLKQVPPIAHEQRAAG